MLNHFNYDFHQGWNYTKKTFLMLILIAVILNVIFTAVVGISLKNGFTSAGNCSLGDVFFYLYHGEVTYHPEWSEKLNLPAVWLVLQGWLYFLLGAYPTQDLHSYGKQIFVRMKKRENWWLSKCLWNVGTVLLFYLILLFVCVAFCILNGFSLNFSLNEVLLNDIYGLKLLEPLGEFEIFMIVLGFPLLISAVIGICQMALSLFIKPLFSYLAVMAYLYLSLVYTNPFFLGNYTMCLRNRWIITSVTETVDPVMALPVAIVFLTAAFAAGWIRIRKYDIF